MAAVSLYLEDALHERAKAHAEKERRSLSAQIAYWAEQAIEKELKKEAASGDAAEVAA
jgi:predicted transcriptional regulator